MKYCLLIWLLAACSPVKQVLKSPEKTLAVVGEYLKRYPIKSDTSVKTLPGDSVVIVDVQTDTLYIFEPPATMPAGTSTDNSSQGNSSGNHSSASKLITKYITKTITRTDTILKVVTDRQFQTALQQQLTVQGIQVTQLEKDKAALLESRNKFRLWFWLLVASIAAIAALLFYLKMKK